MRHFILLVLFSTISVHSQSFFQAYQDQKGVQFLSVNPMMFRLLGQMDLQSNDPETAAYLAMIKSIRSFKVLVTEEADIAASLTKTVRDWVSNENMELLLQLEETENILRFYAELGEDEIHVKRLLMFSKGKGLENAIRIQGKKLQSVLLFLEGNINLELVGRLTEVMDLPGGDQLKKIQQ